MESARPWAAQETASCASGSSSRWTPGNTRGSCGRTKRKVCSASRGSTRVNRTTTGTRTQHSSRLGRCSKANTGRASTNRTHPRGKRASVARLTRATTLKSSWIGVSSTFRTLTKFTASFLRAPKKVLIDDLSITASRSPEDTSNPSPPSYPLHPSYTPLQSQVCSFVSPAERSYYLSEKPPMAELSYNQNPFTTRWDTGYQFSGSFYSCSASEPLPSAFTLDASMKSAEAMALSDYRLHVAVYYQETLVREVTVNSLEGCVLGVSKDGLPYGASQGPEFVELPQIEHSSLEHGVLLWMAPDGLYARRCCPCRVYWEGGHTLLNSKLNKLQRDQTCKLLDTQQFITELQSYARHIRPPPISQVLLFFEADSTELHIPRRTLTVQVEPLFARQLLYFTHPSSMNYIRSHSLSPLSPEQTIPPSQEFHRVISHHHSNSL